MAYASEEERIHGGRGCCFFLAKAYEWLYDSSEPPHLESTRTTQCVQIKLYPNISKPNALYGMGNINKGREG